MTCRVFQKYSPIKRKLLQIIAFGYSNVFAGNFTNGKLYTGEWKRFCNPGMNCYSCPAATLACPIGALQAVAASPRYNLSFYVIGLILALGVVFGRAICAFFCPFGLIQELLYKIPTPKAKLPAWARWGKYVMLVVFVLALPLVLTTAGNGTPAFCEYICPVGTLEAGIPLLATHPELSAVVGWLFSWKAVVLAATLVGCVLVQRFFCKCMCPLGAIYGLLNKVSLYGLRHMPARCTGCGSCAQACPMGINPVHAASSTECIRCGACAAACDQQAIELGFALQRKEMKVQ